MCDSEFEIDCFMSHVIQLYQVTACSKSVSAFSFVNSKTLMAFNKSAVCFSLLIDHSGS